MSQAGLVELVERRRPEVIELAIPLSLAVRIDPPLVRALRREVVPETDTTVEVDLWSSPLVRVRGRGELTLRAEVIDVLRRRLPTAPDRLRAIRAAYESCRAGAPPLIVLEEHLAYLAHLAAHGMPADEQGTGAAVVIDRKLKAVVAAMSHEPSRRRDLAAWSARALARLPAIVRDSEGAKILGAALGSWVAAPVEVRSLAPSPEGARLARSLASVAVSSRRKVAVRRIGARLDVVPTSGHTEQPPWVTIEIAASPFSIIVDDDQVVPLQPDEVTTISVGARDIRIGDTEGHRWLVPARHDAPDLGGIAAIVGTHGPGLAYLVEPAVAVTSARLLGTPKWVGTLWFSSGTTEGRVVSYDEDADCALLELASPVDAAPLKLTTDTAVNAVWRAFDPDVDPYSPSHKGPQAWRGRVAAAGTALRIEANALDVPRPGAAVFVGDRVIGHVTGPVTEHPAGGISGAPIFRDGEAVGLVTERPAGGISGAPILRDGEVVILESRSLLPVCPASIVEWWRAHRAAPDRRSIPLALVRWRESGITRWRDQCLGAVVAPSLVLVCDERIDTDAEGEVTIGDTAFLLSCVFHVGGIAAFASSRTFDVEPLEPAIAEEVVGTGSTVELAGPQGMQRAQVLAVHEPERGMLLASIPEAPSEGSAVLYNGALVGLTGFDDPPAGVVCVRMLDREVIERIRAHRAASRPRRAIVVSPVPVSPGILSTRVAHGEGASRFRTHVTTGRRPWEIEVLEAGHPLPANANEGIVVTLEKAVTIGSTAFSPMRVDGTFNFKELDPRWDRGHVREALAGAANLLEQPVMPTSRFDPDGPPDTRLHIAVTCVDGLPDEYGFRRGLRLVVEFLAELDRTRESTISPDSRPLHVVVDGARLLDIAILDTWIAGLTPHDARVAEIDPETDVVTIVGGTTSELVPALLSSTAYQVGQIYRPTDRRDQLRGYFGIVPTRRRRSLRAIPRGDRAELRVTSVDARPLCGYVSFWVPPELGPSPIRVRASGGVATAVIPCVHAVPFTIGAVVEDEALPLEMIVEPALPRVTLIREQTLQQSGDRIWDAALLPDGRRIVIGSEDRLLRMYELASGHFMTFRGHEGRVLGCTATADGRRIVSASGDRTLYVWDVETRRPLLRYTGHRDGVCACLVMPDGRRVVSASADHSLQVWDLTSGAKYLELKGHTGRVTDCSLASDLAVVSASSDGTVRVWNLVTGEELMVLEGHLDRVNACAVARSGRVAVSASFDRTLRIWDVATGETLHKLEGHADPVQTCAISPDELRIASGDDAGTIRLWDLQGRALGDVPNAHRGAVLRCLWLSPDRLLSAGADGAIHVWQLEPHGTGLSRDGRASRAGRRGR